MKSIVLVLVSVWISLFFAACGGSSVPSEEGKPSATQEEPSQSTSPTKSSIIGYVIDSPIWGLSYSCAGEDKSTDKNGKFECKSLPVTFKVGTITVGTISKVPSDKKVFPQDILNLSRGDVTDSKVVKLASFFQSLDDDGHIDDAIKIDDNLKKKLQFAQELSIQKDIERLPALLKEKANIQPVDEEDAQKHLRKNLTKDETAKAIELSFSANDIPMGLTADVATKGIYQIDGNDIKSIITENVTYSTSDPSLATVDNNGKIQALKEGTVTITANYKGLSTSSDITISHTTLIKIEIVPPTMAELSARYWYPKVNGYYSTNNIVKDVTSQAIWSSTSPLLSNIPFQQSANVLGINKEGNVSISVEVGEFRDTVKFEMKRYPIKEYKVYYYKGYYYEEHNETLLPDTLAVPKGTAFSSAWGINFNYGEVSSSTGGSYYGSDESSNFYTASTFYLSGIYEDNSSLPISFTLASDNEEVVGEGIYNGYERRIGTLKEGTATLTLKADGFEKEIQVTVTKAVPAYLALQYSASFTPLNKERNIDLAASVYYIDGQNKSLSLTDINITNLTPDTLSLDKEHGTITGIKIGTGRLKVTYTQEGVTVESEVGIPVYEIKDFTIGDIYATSIGVSSNLWISDVQYSQSDGSMYTDGVSQIIQNLFTWKSSDETIAKIENTETATRINFLKEGKVTISASYASSKDVITRERNITVYH